MPSVAIVIPVYKEEMTPYEVISLQQCYAVLGNYKILFVCPKKMKMGPFYQSQKSKAQFIFLEDDHFKTITTYNHMLLSVWFYTLFIEYRYILIYQLDCFVFRDELMFWVNQSYSYIGAPWFNSSSNEDDVNAFMGVGNGGFSLRNVKDSIAVLKSPKKIYTLKDCILLSKPFQKPLNLLRGFKLYFKIDTFKTIHNNKMVNEDKIFSLAGRRLKFFKIPSSEKAISFAFEMQPRKLYKLNNNQLPFGCHAWWKYDLEFYMPFFKKFGYQVNKLDKS